MFLDLFRVKSCCRNLLLETVWHATSYSATSYYAILPYYTCFSSGMIYSEGPVPVSILHMLTTIARNAAINLCVWRPLRCRDRALSLASAIAFALALVKALAMRIFLRYLFDSSCGFPLSHPLGTPF